MACDEFSKAIDWLNSGDGTHIHPVVVYFTKHFAFGESFPQHQDSVHYATGEVAAKASPKPHLSGVNLPVFTNSGKAGKMVQSSELTYDLEIFPDGNVSYLMKVNGKPVGGMPATQLSAACVDNRLLTGVSGDAVIGVGVAQEPEQIVPS
jgi:hypothetical protein